MDTKLTLKLDADIIEKAKIYAAESNTSLSKLIENYLSAITSTIPHTSLIHLKIPFSTLTTQFHLSQ